jgi:hypothetical protein
MEAFWRIKKKKITVVVREIKRRLMRYNLKQGNRWQEVNMLARVRKMERKKS